MRVGAVLGWALAGAVVVAVPTAGAQEINARVGKLESEMRAVQRKVFPGGAGQYVQPDIAADQPPAPLPGTPASTPVADLNARVSTLEQNMASLTGQIEQNQYRIRQLEEQFAAYRRATDAKLAAGPVASPAGGGGGVGPGDAGATPFADTATDDTMAPARPARGAARAPATRAPARTPDAAPSASTDAVASTPPARADRARRVAAIERPDTGDASEDGYNYGYRLWQAKLYPEAEVALKQVVADHPKSKRASYAQNLLGRSYLDDGKPSLASIAFYDSYKKYPDGERAPDSLFYLASALQKLGKPADACKVYGELTDVYAAKLTAGMKADVAKGRTTAKCQ